MVVEHRCETDLLGHGPGNCAETVSGRTRKLASRDQPTGTAGRRRDAGPLPDVAFPVEGRLSIHHMGSWGVRPGERQTLRAELLSGGGRLAEADMDSSGGAAANSMTVRDDQTPGCESLNVQADGFSVARGLFGPPSRCRTSRGAPGPRSRRPGSPAMAFPPLAASAHDLGTVI